MRALRDLLSHPRMGSSWEGLVIEEILRGLAAQGTAIECSHYRTGAGAEVDLVLEGDFGLVPVEIKYTQSIEPRRLRSLRDFVSQWGCPFGLVINNDTAVRRLDDRILGVPFACL